MAIMSMYNGDHEDYARARNMIAPRGFFEFKETYEFRLKYQVHQLVQEEVNRKIAKKLKGEPFLGPIRIKET